MSERGFASGLQTELSAANANLCLMLYVDWPGGAGRYWSGVGTESYGGNSWAGVAEFASIDKVADSLDRKDIGIEITLNFLDAGITGELIASDPVGAEASLFLARYAGSIQDAYEMFPGFVDEVEFLDAGNQGASAVLLRLASELARLKRPCAYQLSDAHQQFLFPGDVGMEFAPHMTERIVWGRASPVAPRLSGSLYAPGNQYNPSGHPY